MQSYESKGFHLINGHTLIYLGEYPLLFYSASKVSFLQLFAKCLDSFSRQIEINVSILFLFLTIFHTFDKYLKQFSAPRQVPILMRTVEIILSNILTNERPWFPSRDQSEASITR